MLGVDEQKLAEWRREENRERLLERRRRELAEALQKQSVTVQDDAGRDVSSAEGQMGRPMTAEQVISRLKKCNAKLVFLKHPIYDMYGVYLSRPDGRVHVHTDGQTYCIKHICGMESGLMPEFSILHKMKVKVPDKDLIGNTSPTREVGWKENETFASETRGWRTVLIRLLHAGLITEADVNKHFGWTPTLPSEKWHKLTT